MGLKGGTVVVTECDENTVNNPGVFSKNNLDKNNIFKRYNAGKEKKKVYEQLKKGYREMAALNLELAEECLEAGNNCQFEYEEKLSECE